MKSLRAPFQPVTPDFDDDVIEQLARGKGVGALVRPEPARAGEGASRATELQTAVPTVPAPRPQQPDEPDLAAAIAGATPRSRMKTINLELPDYVWTELKIRAARRQTSVRHIVMTLLRNDGIDINDADLVEDGRRLRK